MTTPKDPMTAEEVIEFLNLKPLKKEGGWYQRSYTSEFSIGDESPMGTAIYYLLKKGEISKLHRLFCDEIFHFYLGDPVEMFILDPVTTEGQWVLLGKDLLNFQFPQYLVESGNWQGMKIKKEGSHGFALLGCTVVPGFEWDKFELADRKELISDYSDHKSEILELTTAP